MDFSRDEHRSAWRFSGLSMVVLAHALLAYALVTGLAHRIVDVVPPPIVTKIIDEVTPPPPPEEPPPPPTMEQPPPPAYMPPPEVVIAQPPPPNTITAVTTTPPPAQQPFVPAAATEQPAAEVAAPVPAFADLNSCKPQYPRAALLAEETGTVRVQFVIGTDSRLVSARVVRSSGHHELDDAAVNGLSRCKFRAAYQDGKPIQSAFLSDYVWKLDE